MNIILVSLDTQRADRLSCYGYHRPTSPHLDQLAREGVRFTDFFSPHIPTYPGHTTMLTGKDLYATGITGQAGSPELGPEHRTLAEMLTDAGYFTAAADSLGRWFSRGFQRYETYHWDRKGGEAMRKGEAVNGAALPLLDACAQQSRPFFLFVHYWDPHTPYAPPPPFARLFYGGNESDPDNHSMDPVLSFPPFMWYFRDWMGHVTDIKYPCALYDGAVAYGDACLGQLLNRMDELRLSSDTLVAVTADHGEELDEHGMWFDHHGLYDTNVHIPLILHLPGRLPAGQTVGGMTRLLDLTPTVLDLAGLAPACEEQHLDGRSLLPLIDRPSSTTRGSCDALFATENTWQKKRAIRTHEWKLIQALEPDPHGTPMQELYHLASDPGEQCNVASSQPDIAAALQERLSAHTAARLIAAGRAEDPLVAQPVPMRRIGTPKEA